MAHEGTRDPLEIIDAGAAGSNFWQALINFTSEDIVRVDPALTEKPRGESGQ